MPTCYYTVLITIKHFRDDTMGSERQWLPHGQYEKTCNLNLNTTNTTDNVIFNGCYYSTRFRSTLFEFWLDVEKAIKSTGSLATQPCHYNLKISFRQQNLTNEQVIHGVKLCSSDPKSKPTFHPAFSPILAGIPASVIKWSNIWLAFKLYDDTQRFWCLQNVVYYA